MVQLAATADGRQEADDDERGARAEPLDEDRREQAAERDPERQDRLEAGEHAREDGLVRHPGQDREPADVDQRVADADQAEQHDRRRLLRDGADERERRAEQRDPDPEPGGEPAAPDQREGEERAEHAARADGRVQDADARVARVEQVDREDDGEHGQAPARERLDDPEPRDQRQRAIARDGREALDDVAAGRSAPGVRPGRHVVGEGHDDQSPPAATPLRTRRRRWPARSRRGARPRPPDRRGWRASPASRAPRSRSSGPPGTWRGRGAGPNAPAGRAPRRPSRRSRTRTSRPRGRRTPSRPRHPRASRRGPPRCTSGPARDEPGRPASRGTARGARRSPCGPR